jgi:hypothetical protein
LKVWFSETDSVVFKENQNPERFFVSIDSLKKEKQLLVKRLKEIKKHMDMIER